jgi:hypothetical protein
MRSQSLAPTVSSWSRFPNSPFDRTLHRNICDGERVSLHKLGIRLLCSIQVLENDLGLFPSSYGPRGSG